MRESEWTRKCDDALESAGAIVIPHVAGKLQANHVPDRSVVTKFGNFWVEFKGANTKVRPGQRILADKINSRFACCFLYRYPNVLYLGDNVRYVDCLAEPKRFIRFLYELTHLVQSDRATNLVYFEPGEEEKP